MRSGASASCVRTGAGGRRSTRSVRCRSADDHASTLFEREGQVSRRQVVGPAQPAWRVRTILREQTTGSGLLAQVGRQIGSAQDRLQVIRQEYSARDARGGVEVHDAPLKPLID